MKYLKLLVIGLFTLGLVSCAQKSSISDGSIVKVKYKGTLADGTVFDTTENKDPLTFLVGASQVIPEFEKQVTSLKPGQSKTFKVAAKEAYGEPDPEKVITLPKDDKFNDIELKEGTVIFANNKAPNGQVVQTPMRVVKIGDKDVTLDYNHPLAGKDLNFEVTLVEVKEPSVKAAPAAAPAPTEKKS
jgi:FKBP-type peptidyl-prolyl cis-trans isomerase 2